MTALAEAPPEPLYHSDRGLYDFQAQGVAYCYERLDNLAVWDTGIGKTHLAMATSAILFEDGLIDHVLVVCEKNKVTEWRADYEKFTRLSAVLYYGDPKKRAALREAPPQVMISTYETSAKDAAKWVTVPKRKTKRLDPDCLTEALSGKRVLVVYDEMTKLGNRGSNLHKAHDLLVTSLRKAATIRVLGLTATPIERSPENFYNLGRILCLESVGTVASFERDHIAAKDIFGNPSKFKNLSAADCDPGVVPFTEKIRPIILRKRKTDADVIDQFPRSTEEITYVPLADRQQEFYEAVKEVFEDADELEQMILFTTLRQIAAHPLSLLSSKAKIAQTIVEQVGEDGLAALGSAKTDALVEYLQPLVRGQGAQVVVFTFFGPSVIPLLKAAIEAAGMSVACNHGGMGDADREYQKAEFKAGRRDVFLTSDAGARGINLPEATYCCVEASTPVLTEDLRWVPAGDLRPGDRLLAGDEYPVEGGRAGARKWRRAEVVENHVQERECVRVTLSNGDSMIVTTDHRMYVETRKGIRDWRRADEVRSGWGVPRYLDVWEAEDSFEAGWVSGMFDGEGWCAPNLNRTQTLGIAQNPGPVLDRLLGFMERSKFRYSHHSYPSAAIERVMILGGRAEQARFLGTYQVSRLVPKWVDFVVGRMMNAIDVPKIVSIEPVGIRKVAVMETTAKTFFAAGYFHHNCEYEMALTHANRTQRLNRIHRIDSRAPSVTFQTFIAPDTVEDGIARNVLKRNEWSDTLLDDDDPGEHFFSAKERKRLLSFARKRLS